MASELTSSQQVLELTHHHRLVAIIRLEDLTHAVEISQALLDGGVVIQEFTLTNPAALDAIAAVRANIRAFKDGSAAIGLGSVRNLTEAHQALNCGAQFVVTPILSIDVIECCRAADTPVMPGAFTPTEIHTAWQAGASMVKVFPSRNLGPTYIKDVLAPMPYLQLMPTGGVDLNNMQSYFDCGAKAVGVGGNIIDSHAVKAQDWPRLTEVAKAYADRARQSH